jgi:hypothetical protein
MRLERSWQTLFTLVQRMFTRSQYFVKTVKQIKHSASNKAHSHSFTILRTSASCHTHYCLFRLLFDAANFSLLRAYSSAHAVFLFYIYCSCLYCVGLDLQLACEVVNIATNVLGMQVFWDVTACRCVSGCRRLGRTYGQAVQVRFYRVQGHSLLQRTILCMGCLAFLQLCPVLILEDGLHFVDKSGTTYPTTQRRFPQNTSRISVNSP